MVVTDYDNKAIKLVDTTWNKVTCRLPLSSVPFDVVAMEPNKVAASLGNEKKLEIFTVTNTLSRNNTLKVNVDPVTLRIGNMSLSIPSIVSLYTFTSPYYIAVGRDRSVQYITDDKAHTVTTMTQSGQITTVYENDLLQDPCGVTVGSDNSVYVCGCDTHTVHQLTAAGKFVRIKLDQQRGLPKYPTAISYDDEQNMLHISSSSLKLEDCDYVKTFKLQ